MTKLQVPTELLYSIFEFLPHSDIVHGTGLASQFWREISYSNRVWKSVCRNNFALNTSQSDVHERQEDKARGYWSNLFKQKCHYICKDDCHKGIQPLLLQSYPCETTKHGKRATGVPPIYLSAKEAVRVFEPLVRRSRTEIERYGGNLSHKDNFILYECDLGRMVILMVNGWYNEQRTCTARYVVPRKDGIEMALGLDKEIDKFYKLKFKEKYVNLADRRPKKTNGRKK